MERESAFVHFGRMENVAYEVLHGNTNDGNNLLKATWLDLAVYLEQHGNHGVLLMALLFERRGNPIRARQIRKDYGGELSKADKDGRDPPAVVIDKYVVQRQMTVAELKKEIRDLLTRRGQETNAIETQMHALQKKVDLQDFVKKELLGAVIRRIIPISYLTGGPRLRISKKTLAEQANSWLRSTQASVVFSDRNKVEKVVLLTTLLGNEIQLLFQPDSIELAARLLNPKAAELADGLDDAVQAALAYVIDCDDKRLVAARDARKASDTWSELNAAATRVAAGHDEASRLDEAAAALHVAEEAKIAATRSHLVASARHHELEAQQHAVREGRANVKLDPKVAEMKKLWELTCLVKDGVWKTPDDIEAWQKNAEAMATLFAKFNGGKSGGYYHHVLVNHVADMMVALRTRFPDGNVSVGCFCLQRGEHLNRRVKNRVIRLYFTLAQDYNGFQVMIEDVQIKLLFHLDTIKAGVHAKCQKCGQHGHIASNQCFHPRAGAVARRRGSARRLSKSTAPVSRDDRHARLL